MNNTDKSKESNTVQQISSPSVNPAKLVNAPQLPTKVEFSQKQNISHPDNET